MLVSKKTLLLKGTSPSTQNWPYKSDTSVLMGVPAGSEGRGRQNQKEGG
jgi:hypothetical protein